MTEKIYITYDNNETVTYSFWKQFFLMSGVWVIGNKYENTEKDILEKIEAESLHLYLLSNRNLSIIKKNTIKDNVFYLMNARHYGDDALYQHRKDILAYDWRKQFTFIDALNKIICEENVDYGKLLSIYINNNLWMSTWLFFELAHDQKTEWDAWILKNSEASIKSLKKFKGKNVKVKNLWNYEFMNLYCKYLKLAVKSRNPEERKVEVNQLLQEVNLLSEKNGWKPALCKLCAAICDLSPLENKKAVVYYKEILEYEKTPEILYKLGRIYEKIYGDIEIAKKYYELADEGEKCYRARYKMASYYETRGDWKHALFLYESIMEQFKNELSNLFYYSITVYDVEYYEKILIKIRDIFQQKFSYKGQELDNLIETIKNNIVDFSRLRKMIHCMRQMSNKISVLINIDKNSKNSEKQRENDFLKNVMSYVQKRIDIYF